MMNFFILVVASVLAGPAVACFYKLFHPIQLAKLRTLVSFWSARFCWSMHSRTT
jgi:hypothetical protein